MNIDWVQDLSQKFSEDKDINSLKDKKFHGSITLNFCNGEIMNYDFKMHKVYSNLSLNDVNQPLRQGGKDG